MVFRKSETHDYYFLKLLKTNFIYYFLNVYKKGTDVKLVVRSTKLKYANFCMATDEYKIFSVACSAAEPGDIPEKSFVLAFGKIYFKQ